MAKQTKTDQSLRLDEIVTNPSALMKWAQGSEAADMVVGFEAEMLIEGLVWPDEEGTETDYDQNEDFPSSYDGFDSAVEDWFANGDSFNESASLRRALRRLDRDYREWAEEQWEDDKDDDRWMEKLRENLADELGVDEDDKLVDAAIEENSYTFRTVQRKLKEEYIEDNDAAWQEYMRLNNLGTMLDFATEFGLDWPYTKSGDGEITPEELEASFVNKTGYSCTVNDTYHGGRPKDTFVMEPDSSLTGEEGYGGLELISPPMALPSAMEAIDRVFDWMSSVDARTDWHPPTGFHIGVSMSGKGVENVDRLKLILMMGDDHVLKQFGRERLSRYAASSYKHIKDNLTQPGFNAEAELSKFRSFLDIQASKDLSANLSSGLRRENTVSIRPSGNYVEFRSPGGDYTKQRGEIKMAVLRFARALSIAADPNAERKEYAKKLYQLLTGALDGKDDTIEAFAAYSSGLMDRDDLRTAIDTYRQRRKTGGFSGPRSWNVVDDKTGKVLGTIMADDSNVMDRLRSWASRNNRTMVGLDAVRQGEQRKVQTYRVTRLRNGNRFDIDAKSPKEALRYAKARWGETAAPDTDYSVETR